MMMLAGCGGRGQLPAYRRGWWGGRRAGEGQEYERPVVNLVLGSAFYAACARATLRVDTLQDTPMRFLATANWLRLRTVPARQIHFPRLYPPTE